MSESKHTPVFGANVTAALYVRDAVIEFSRRAMLSDRDARTVLSVRDRMMMLAGCLDAAELRIVELEEALIELNDIVKRNGLAHSKRASNAILKAQGAAK